MGRAGCDVDCVVVATEPVERRRPGPYDQDGEGEAPRVSVWSTLLGQGVARGRSSAAALMGRATATILFTDLVGSTELRGRLGEEAADELRRKHDQLLVQAVEANHGRVVKGLGDGIMAAFGGAADAVAAAVAIQQAVDRLNRSGKAPVPVAVRVGLSAGDVASEDDDVHGTPVIEAARLCGEAVGGEILASEVVRWLGGAQGASSFIPVGSLELKGLAAPVPALRIEWDPAVVSPVPLPALLTEVGRIFVGRDSESERLGQLWKEAASGDRRVALLAGEPGVGKTRLAAELAIGVHDQGGVVLAGRCDEDLGVPFQPFVEALHHYAAHASELRLGRYGGELTRLVPELASNVPGLPGPLRSDPETERYRLFDAVVAWLGEVSADDPVLLVLDDVHWAAKPTLLLLRHVLRAAEPLRLLVVATYRDSEVGRGHPLAELLADLRRVEGVARFPLTGLDQSGVAAFIEAAAGHALAEGDEGLPQALWAETEGNPFFMVEVLRHLAETGGVEQRGGRWVTTASVEQLGIPEGVRDVVGRRLSHLSEAANRALWVASVAGLEFDPTVVRMAGDLSAEALFSSLEEAVAARLVAESGSRYRFSHALVRATLYDEMSAVRRVALHRSVAEAIETIHAGALDDHLPALAHHWARASAPAADIARAVDYAGRAGDRALAQLAHDEAAAYYRQALELLDASGPLADGSQRCELLISLGEAQRRVGEPSYRDTLLAAARIASEAGDPERLTRAALANHRGLWSVAGEVDADRVAMLEAAVAAQPDPRSAVRARLLAQLATEVTFAGDPDRTRRLAHAALDIMGDGGEPSARAQVLIPIATAIWSPDTVDERLSVTADLLAAAEAAGDPVLVFWANLFRTIVTFEVPDGAEASRCVAMTRQLAYELRQPLFGWLSGMVAATLAAATGRLRESEELALESYRLAEATGQPDAAVYFGGQLFVLRQHQGRLGEMASDLDRFAASAPALTIVWRTWRAAVHCEDGQYADARAQFGAAMAGLSDQPRDPIWLPAVVRLASIGARLADLDGAVGLSALLRPYEGQAASTGAGWAGSVAHYLGLLAAVLGEFEEADDRFRHAEGVHERFGAAPWTARTRLEWARMLLTRRKPGDTDQARELLGQALTTARELGLAKVERDAVALLQ